MHNEDRLIASRRGESDVGDFWMLKVLRGWWSTDGGRIPILGEIQWFLRFHGPPIPSGQGLCGFDQGWSFVIQ